MSQSGNVLAKIILWAFQWLYSKLLAFVFGGTPKTIPSTKDSLLMESATSLANRIRSQKVTSYEVVRSYINRIKEINEVLNCVVDERFDDALAEAQKVDEMIGSGKKTAEELERETPFLGVPFTAPESVAVKGLSNTMGAWSRRTEKADADASEVSSMREGGAIPLACTNVSEWCSVRETNNPLFGRTENPYDTNRTVGGPFGGEACLIASSGSPLGVVPSPGLPCAFSGVFGHKPSANARREVSGPVSRSSADLLPALNLLLGNSKTQLKLDEPVDVKKLKYYFADGDSGSAFATSTTEDVKQVMKTAVSHLKNSQKARVEPFDVKRLTRAFPICKARLREVGADKEDKINFRKELVKVMFGKSNHTFVFLLSSMMEERVRSDGSSSSKQVAEDCTQLFTEFQELLGSDGVFLCPTQPATAFRHNESLVKGFDFGYADAFEAAGLPTTYCPAGLDSDGLPVGIQVVAAMNQDRLTLAVAREMEKLFGGWKPPPTHGNFTLKNSIFRNQFDKKFKTL